MTANKQKEIPAEGRVNVPLGERKTELREIARRDGTNETMLARTLIFYCLDRIKSGELKFTGPAITQATDGEGAP